MVVFSLDGDRLICAFSGQMDTLTTASLTSEVTARAAEASGPVVFDLAEVEYVSSAFLRLCLQVGRKRRRIRGAFRRRPRPSCGSACRWAGRRGPDNSRWSTSGLRS
jgi:hypothetical protein